MASEVIDRPLLETLESFTIPSYFEVVSHLPPDIV